MDINDSRWMVAIAVLVVAVAIGAWWLYRRQQSERLKQRFGPEYARTVQALGSETKAESELMARQRRVERLTLVPLEPAEAARFSASWTALQARFVDDPGGVVIEAEELVRTLMLKRGYPMGDFERLAADISVDHPAVVDHYRQAQGIATRCRSGEADTEQLRSAVVHYRALFDDLLETTPDRPAMAAVTAPADPLVTRA